MRTIRFFLPLAMLVLLSVGNATTTRTVRHASALAAEKHSQQGTEKAPSSDTDPYVRSSQRRI